VHGLVPCGTTGENPALTHDEWAKVIETTVAGAEGEAWVVAGTGTNNTPDSVRRSRIAADLGADGALVITPYYNKPTVDGLLLHFRRVAEEGGLPVMVYNVPGRTALNLRPDGLERLLEIEGVAAVKEASGDLGQVWEVAARFGDRVPVFSGEDAQNLPILEVGGAGYVSVLSNVVPDLVVRQYEAQMAGNREEALGLHRRLAPLASALFLETSPSPAKHALGLLGLPSGPVREPLAPLREESGGEVERELNKLNLL
jgi:4-hydroxy-tetrahydrodipicolinate synthase